MKLRAYAKINLGLRVFQRQADSYHRIQGLMQSIGLCDQLVLERFGKGIELSVEPPLGIPAEENLAYRAAELMVETANLTPNLRIQLMKRIPVGAGLGGGSSDAAAVLVGINELFNLGMDKAKLLELAAELGSDPSFFLEGGTCLVGGRGERIKRIPPLPEYHLALLIPPFSLSTAAVYRQFDRLGSDGGEFDEKSPRLLPFLRNDLERAALQLRPELGEYRNLLGKASPDFFGMSGSGPAWFAGFRDRARAEAVAAEAAKLPGRALAVSMVEQGYEIE